MTAPELLAAWTARGVHLRVAGGRLYARPGRLLTPADWLALSQHRAALIALLTPATEARLGDALAVFPGAIITACPACGGTSWGADATAERCATCGGVSQADAMGPEAPRLLRAAAAAGWPCAPMRPGLTILGTPWAWVRFVHVGDPEDQVRAAVYLRESVPVAETATARRGSRAPCQTGPWQVCLQCGGRTWWHAYPGGDHCVTCTLGPEDA